MKSKILVIIGSASRESSNAKLMNLFLELTAADFEVTIFDDLGSLPHFDPLLRESFPVPVADLLSRIESADGVIICSPEYIFSIPARVKNLLEWVCSNDGVFG